MLTTGPQECTRDTITPRSSHWFSPNNPDISTITRLSHDTIDILLRVTYQTPIIRISSTFNTHTCAEYLHYHIILLRGKILDHKTSLARSRHPLLKYPFQAGKISGHVNMCWGHYIVCFYDFSILRFGNVPTQWYSFYFMFSWFIFYQIVKCECYYLVYSYKQNKHITISCYILDVYSSYQ